MGRKRDIIKKVIAYMTLGIDVSRLFTEMIMAIETKDIVVKKMVYHYLSNYAHQNPDLALMCINTLRRDCDNEDPMVRGLALRSLCSLRLDSILEYVEGPLEKSLVDLSAYVRKTGVMGVLKVYSLRRSVIERGSYLEQLYKMLDDADASVISNAIVVLDEIYADKGGMELTHETLMKLLNRIGEFSEWGLNSIVELVTRYTPADDEETYSIMNLLDPMLRTANSGAVLATLRCFIHLTENMTELHPQLYIRAKPPLLTLVTGGQPEIQYAILRHLEILLPRPAAQGIFDDEYRQFFVRYNEPPHIKHMKVGLLPWISNQSNSNDIAQELGEYVTDVDAELSKRAISAIGAIAMRVPSVATDMTVQIVELVDLDISYVRSEAIVNMASIVRVFPDMKAVIVPCLSRCLRRIEDNDAKAAVVWMVGEFGEEIIEAPYMLEPIIDSYDDDLSPSMKLQLLVATMKLFFKRPPEVQHMLGRLLKSAINDLANQDVHDRALLYYRLLNNDLQTISTMFNEESKSKFDNGEGKIFFDQSDSELRGQIFMEFNTLAVIYGVPSTQFIDEIFQRAIIKRAIVPPPNAELSQTSKQGTDTPISFVGSVNLLDMGDDNTTNNVSANHSNMPTLKLNVSPQMNPQLFQEIWGAHTDAFNNSLCVLSTIPSTTADVEANMKACNIMTMASGPLPDNLGLKFFLYAQESDDNDLLGGGNNSSVFLVQLTIASSGDVTCVVKTSNPSTTVASTIFLDHIISALTSFGAKKC